MNEFALETGGPKRLRFEKRQGKTWQVSLDGGPLREVTSEPKVPQTVTLPDGRELEIEWKMGFLNVGQGWHAAIAGKPLPGTVGDPDRIQQEAAASFYAIAAITAIAALLALVGVGFIRKLGVSEWSFIDAAVMGGLGYGVHKKMRWALIVGMLLYLAGSIYTMSQALAAGGNQGGLTGAALVRVMLFAPMVRALLLKK